MAGQGAGRKTKDRLQAPRFATGGGRTHDQPHDAAADGLCPRPGVGPDSRERARRDGDRTGRQESRPAPRPVRPNPGSSHAPATQRSPCPPFPDGRDAASRPAWPKHSRACALRHPCRSDSRPGPRPDVWSPCPWGDGAAADARRRPAPRRGTVRPARRTPPSAASGGGQAASPPLASQTASPTARGGRGRRPLLLPNAEDAAVATSTSGKVPTFWYTPGR